MKKYTLLVHGSLKEKNFLNTMLTKGYVLKNTGLLSYTFEKIENIKNYSLVIEYSDKPLTNFDPNIKENLNLLGLVEKRLFLTKYYLIYSYIPSDKISLSESNGVSNSVELNYLRKFKSKLQILQTVIILISVLIISSLYVLRMHSEGTINKNMFYMLFIFITISAIYITKISNKISTLRNVTGDFSDIDSSFTWTITIKDQLIEPDVTKLSFLGKWRLVSVSKRNDVYYYRLTSDFSSDDIIYNISNTLNIDKNLISTRDTSFFSAINWV